MPTKKVVNKVPEVDREKIEEREAKMDAKAAAETLAKLREQEKELNDALADDLGKMQERDPERRLTNATSPFMPDDYTEVPEYADLDGGGRRRIKDPEVKYRWVRYQGRNPRVSSRRLKGWRPVLYDDKFIGTGLYEKTVQGYSANGDCILMWISKDGHDRMRRDLEAIRKLRSGIVEDSFHNDMDNLGMDSFIEDEDGKRLNS
jgi:hypothetical protein